jgi:hypothetical protein
MIHAIYIYLIIGAWISGYVISDMGPRYAFVIIPWIWPFWTVFCWVHNHRQRKASGQ